MFGGSSDCEKGIFQEVGRMLVYLSPRGAGE